MSLTHPSSRLLAPSTRRSLAACIAAACSAVALPALATVQVTDCGDAGPGTLREALASTDPVVDVSACTQIALTSGELVESHDYVQITGNHTIITSSGASRVLSHTGTGKLSLISLEIADGAVTDVLAQGGCIESQGNVYLFASTVRNCTVTGTTAPPVDGGAFGGGIHARGSVTLNHSVVRDNTVFNAMGTYSYAGGGGIFAGGALFVQNSTISGNSVIGGGVYSHGGGAMAAGAAAVGYSTISDNEAPSGGAIDFGNGLTTSFVLNSTISGNRSEWGSAGLQSHDATLHVSNSTIAFNALGNPVDSTEGSGAAAGAGVLMFAPGAYLILRSSIVARNTRLGQPDDISSLGPVTIQGNGNLVIASSQPLPADTITTDPLLMPLADNGGPVATHALRPGSPAIDHGDNFLSLTYDARDAGFDRVVGAAADIGAYEVQAAGLDVIFADGFDVVFPSGVPRG